MANTTPKRHSTSPRVWIKENITLENDTTIKIGDPYVRGHDFGWKDIIGQIIVKGTGANDPEWAAITDLGGMFAYKFSELLMKEVWLIYHIDHDYAEGTPVYAHVHWMNGAAVPNTGNVKWNFEYTVAKGHSQQAFNAPTTVSVVAASSATRFMHQLSEISVTDAIPATRLEPDSLILMRVYRDPADVADTCTDPVFLLTADIHYQVGKFCTKQRTPDFNAY